MDKSELDPEPGPLAAIRELLAYNWADEERDYRENPPDETGRGWHIFERMQEIRAWLDDLEAYGITPGDVGPLIVTLGEVWGMQDYARAAEDLTEQQVELAERAYQATVARMEA